MQPVISITHLSKHFKNLVAVDNLSFTVMEGDVYGFLGQNGAGKSTTLRMLLTLIQPTSGSIHLYGMDLTTHRSKILARIGAVIEKPDLYQYLSAHENLRLFARMSGLKLTTAQLMQQLETVGLAERAHDKVKTFSQGMKQRLGIGAALVHDPDLIILDEPTNGLDPQGIADVRNLILHLSHDRKKTVVVSSHLLAEIEQIATRMLIIDRGKKLVEGTASELFDPAQTVMELAAENNAAALLLLQASQWQPYIQPAREGNILLKFHRNQLPDFHSWLVQQGIRITALQSRHSLEDYFLQVTSGKQHVDNFTN